MNWTMLIGPGVSLLIAVLSGYATYLVFRTKTETAIARIDKDISEGGKRKDEAIAAVDRKVEKAEQEIGLTNSRITVVEKSVIELGAKAVTRDDMKELKLELVDRMDALGDRMENTVDRIVTIISAKPTRPSSSRAKAGS